MDDIRQQAEQRVRENPELNRYQDIIMVDKPRDDDHWRWVANAPADEVARWAEQLREDAEAVEEVEEDI